MGLNPSPGDQEPHAPRTEPARRSSFYTFQHSWPGSQLLGQKCNFYKATRNSENIFLKMNLDWNCSHLSSGPPLQAPPPRGGRPWALPSRGQPPAEGPHPPSLLPDRTRGRPRCPSGPARYPLFPAAAAAAATGSEHPHKFRPGPRGPRPASPGECPAGRTRWGGCSFWFSSSSVTDRIYLEKKIAKILSYTFAIFTQGKGIGNTVESVTPFKNQYVVQTSPLSTGTN